jgi:hypothetical protein
LSFELLETGRIPGSTPAPAAPAPLSFQFVETGPIPGPTPAEDALIQAGCASCGGGGNGLVGPPDPSGGLLTGCSSCGHNGCVPGHTPCDYCDKNSLCGRFFCGLYECICCPDPCYEPRWIPIADSAFFVDAPRPITQSRIRWDSGWNLIFPDRAEYFWASPPVGPAIAGSAFHAEKRLNYNQLSLYTEVATGLISFFFDMPYRSQEGEVTPNAAGFSDINLGTKSLLFDCELLQVSLQMKTYLPSGNFNKGLGTGHVSLEPTLLVGLRLGPDTYLQTQIGEWIPFGSPSYSGSILLANASLNQVLWRPLRNVPLIGTLEGESWSFQHGNYTDPVLGAWQKASGYTYLNIGPGLRLVICDRADLGVGSSFAVTQNHWAEYLFRTEFRFRY